MLSLFKEYVPSNAKGGMKRQHPALNLAPLDLIITASSPLGAQKKPPVWF
jgi:hypothetical protein